ncbi:hypothetical protein CY34DRAFT_152278 [Suillus luteus UH-Slu-Lm8-n1]|uniref:Uncharacterized protein n=1 Tax=Suillus luteus UH-Slu-Lm8-n1 TaxID=930992 RepID=A0A0D0BGK2_9AGAM|nr:hypothetical protein CY34DRAFT_152278 [Suillus luteus UH-Slu-Lm8-n1]
MVPRMTMEARMCVTVGVDADCFRGIKQSVLRVCKYCGPKVLIKRKKMLKCGNTHVRPFCVKQPTCYGSSKCQAVDSNREPCLGDSMFHTSP